MHGIAKESCEEVAAQLGVSQSAVERAYCAAFDTLHLIEKDALLLTWADHVGATVR